MSTKKYMFVNIFWNYGKPIETSGNFEYTVVVTSISAFLWFKHTQKKKTPSGGHNEINKYNFFFLFHS